MPTAVGSDGCRIHWIEDGAGDLRGKDHMTAVGAREHREAVLRFLEKL